MSTATPDDLLRRRTLEEAVQRVKALDVYLDRNDEPIYRIAEVVAAIMGHDNA